MDPIAVYAALVGSASLGWQVFTWRHRQRTAVVVGVDHSVKPPFEPMIRVGRAPKVLPGGTPIDSGSTK